MHTATHAYIYIYKTPIIEMVDAMNIYKSDKNFQAVHSSDR